jgi:hypothetical protein
LGDRHAKDASIYASVSFRLRHQVLRDAGVPEDGAADSTEWSAVSLGGGDQAHTDGGQVSELGDARSSLGDAKSSLGDAKSLLGDAKSSLGDAKSSLGHAKSSLGHA